MPSCRSPWPLPLLLLAPACAPESVSAPEAVPSQPALQAGAPVLAPGFHWLPPLVRHPGPFDAPFDPTRQPTVRLRCLTSASPPCPIVARFDGATPPPGRVTMDSIEELYAVTWLDTQTLVPGAGLYRLEVLEGPLTLASTDVHVVATEREARDVPAGAIAIVRGRPLPIRFRLESVPRQVPVTLEIIPSPITMAPGEVVALEAVQRNALGEAVAGHPVQWSGSSPAVATVDPSGLLTALSEGALEITATAGPLEQVAPAVVAPLPLPAQAAIGPAGGSLRAPLSDGGTLELIVSPGAVTSPVTFGISPGLRQAGQQARFGLAPSGRLLGAPMLIAYTPPPGVRLGPSAYLAWPVTGGRMLLRLAQDQSQNRWMAATRLVGDFPSGPPAAAGVSLRAAPPATPAAEEGHADVSVETGISNADLLAAGREALQAFLAAPGFATVNYLARTVELVATGLYTDAELAERNAFLQEWRTAVCAAGHQAVQRFAALPVATWDLSDFDRETATLLAFAAAAEQTTLQQELSLPFDGCAEGQPAFRDALEASSQSFAPLVEGLVNPPNRDLGVRFEEMLTVQIPRFVDFQGVVAALGVQPLFSAIEPVPREILASLRRVAWQSCRVQRNQARLTRLMEVEVAGTEALSAYTLDDLLQDLPACTTELEWRVRPTSESGELGSVERTGVLTTPSTGLPPAVGAEGLRSGRALVLAGRIQPVVCDAGTASPSLNAEELVVRARSGAATAVLATRPRPASLGLAYLQSDSIVVTEAALVQAFGDDWTEAELTVVRSGRSCAGVFALLPVEAVQATLTLTRQPIRVQLTPETVTLAPGEQAELAATVEHSDQGVTWEVTGGTAAGDERTVVFTAGDTEGTFRVIARSIEWSGSADTTVVTVQGACPAAGAAGTGPQPSAHDCPGGGLELSGGALPDAIAGIPYAYPITASGGQEPLQWSLGGSVPPGLTINPSTGVVSGVPSLPGGYAMTVTVRSGSESATAPYPITVRSRLTADPWIGNYLGTGTIAGAGVMVSSSFVSYRDPIYTATFGVFTPDGSATLYQSFSCAVFGPPTVTSTTGQCGTGQQAMTFALSTTWVQGVPKRQLTGTATNIPVAPGSQVRSTLTFTLVER